MSEIHHHADDTIKRRDKLPDTRIQYESSAGTHEENGDGENDEIVVGEKRTSRPSIDKLGSGYFRREIAMTQGRLIEIDDLKRQIVAKAEALDTRLKPLREQRDQATVRAQHELNEPRDLTTMAAIEEDVRRFAVAHQLKDLLDANKKLPSRDLRRDKIVLQLRIWREEYSNDPILIGKLRELAREYAAACARFDQANEEALLYAGTFSRQEKPLTALRERLRNLTQEEKELSETLHSLKLDLETAILIEMGLEGRDEALSLREVFQAHLRTEDAEMKKHLINKFDNIEALRRSVARFEDNPKAETELLQKILGDGYSVGEIRRFLYSQIHAKTSRDSR